MQLKQYQQQALRDLEQYLDVLGGSRSLAAAYAAYWAARGADVLATGGPLRPYCNTVPGTPRVALKVPTAGGKTLLACHALRLMADSLCTDGGPVVVAWFVPSDTILSQTLLHLQDPRHPYRQTLDSLFAHRVTVIDKAAALAGQGMHAAQLADGLTVLVLSAQSFVERRTAASGEAAKPLAYRENGNLAEYAPASPDAAVDDSPTALINVLARLRPLVVDDEAHNFASNLREEMLLRLRPRFILDLTATPRPTSNVVSFIDAMQLKREHMVKLPVVVDNRRTAADVLSAAIGLRRSLEEQARAEQADGGRYIRPIVLFQAQPKNAADNVTFERIRAALLAAGIADEEIRVKTATRDELHGEDLMSPSCPVRYIITVNALKEGWDCPFAYILATVANRTSRVDVEQVLGRILRQPYAARHANPLLNMSYVFTCSDDFRQTVEDIILSLQKAGFSRNDYREALPPAPPSAPSQATVQTVLEAPQPATAEDEQPDLLPADGMAAAAETDIERLTRQAIRISHDYQQEAARREALYNDDPLAAIATHDMTIKNQFKAEAAAMRLPLFCVKTRPNIFSDDVWVPLERAMLGEGFDLNSQDSRVDFATMLPSGSTIDLAETTDGYEPVRRDNREVLANIRQAYQRKSLEGRRDYVRDQIAHGLRLDNCTEADKKAYIARALAPVDADTLAFLAENPGLATAAVEAKVSALLDAYRAECFRQWIDLGRVRLEGRYTFPQAMPRTRDVLVGVDKGLYTEEDCVNGFEYEVATALAACPNVRFWHRNRERTGFALNGDINHYPDFIVRMTSGRTLLVETKGDHLDGADSRQKIQLGNRWAALAGDGYRYFMVFQSKEVDGAITLSQLLQYIAQL